MIPYLILDTGPLVAVFNPNDPHHEWAKEQLRNAGAAYITCEAVLTESAYFLTKSRWGLPLLLDFIDSAPVDIPFDYIQNRDRIRELMMDYADVPMSFADACLVRLSELYPDAPVVTLDSDFLIYRRNRNEQLPVLLPASRKRT